MHTHPHTHLHTHTHAEKKRQRKARTSENCNAVWWDIPGECWLFLILAFIKDINLKEETEEAVSGEVKN